MPNSPYAQYSLQTLSSPLLHSIGTTNRFFHGFFKSFDDIKNWFSSRSTLHARLEKSEQIEAELVQVKLELITAQKILKQLEPLTNFKSPNGFNRVSVRVYGSPTGFYDAQMITAAPAAITIKKDDIAITEKGLVGRVTESSRQILRIMLITDMVSRVPVKVLETGENAIIVGNGTSTLFLEHLQSREMITNSYKRPPEVGDVLVTSGVGEIFPSDIPVGVVTAVKDEEITVKPFVTFHVCEIVSILYGHVAS